MAKSFNARNSTERTQKRLEQNSRPADSASPTRLSQVTRQMTGRARHRTKQSFSDKSLTGMQTLGDCRRFPEQIPAEWTSQAQYERRPGDSHTSRAVRRRHFLRAQWHPLKLNSLHIPEITPSRASSLPCPRHNPGPLTVARSLAHSLARTARKEPLSSTKKR